MLRRILLLVVVAMMASPISAAVILQVDFNSNQDDGGDSSTAGDPGASVANHNQADWSSYHANHEVAAEFSTADYGGITVTPGWPNTTDNRVQQCIDRAPGNDGNWNNGAGDLNLVTDWIGIDTRTANGGNGNWDGSTGTPTYLTITLGGLTAGAYEWTSFHHDTEHCHGPFAVWISVDGGANFVQLPDGVMTDSTPGGQPDSGATETGPDAYSLPSTYSASFNANGTDDVVLRFAPYADAAGVHRQIWGMNGFELEAVSADQAFGPTPANGDTDVERSAVLSWMPADGTAAVNGHKLLFSEDFDAVNDGLASAEIAVLSDPVFDVAALPFALQFGKEYFWRVDQASTPGGPFMPGAVWSFTVEPEGLAIPPDSITATASSTYGGTSPAATINGSGLDPNDQHSTADADAWLSDPDDANDAWIRYEFDKVYPLHQLRVWNYNGGIEGAIGVGIEEATIEYSVDGQTWISAGDYVFEQAPVPTTDAYAFNTTVDLAGVAAKYVRINANSNFKDLLNQYGLSEVRFLYLPVWAREPDPAPAATDRPVDNVTLDWRAGRGANSHDLYISSDRNAVANETVAPVSIPLGGSYDTGELELGQTYYWKVNAVNQLATPNVWEGEIWSFDTQPFLVVDDIEDYNNFTPDTVWETWIDGFGDPANGSQVGHDLGPSVDPGENYVELVVVHGGSKSMPFYYDNTVAASSEATANIAELPAGPDWTTNGIKVLSLWFRGDPNSTATEQMYVKLNGAEVPYDGQPYDLTQSAWKQWNIDLAEFEGVDLSNITEITIGFRPAAGMGGSGVIYFDDIRLYPSICQPSLVSTTGDLDNNCVVDLADVDALADQWLAAGLLVTPQTPSASGLLSQWQFDGNADDSVGTNHAQTTGGPTYTTGMTGQAIVFDGQNDYALVEGSFDLPVYSVSLWFRSAGGPGQQDLFSVYNDAGAHGILIEIQTNGTLRFLHRAPLDTGGGTNIATSVSYEDGAWHHAAIVKSATTTAGYVNGALVDEGEDDTEFGEPLQYIAMSLLKHNTDTLGRYFPGMMDDVRLYSRALSYAEVAGLAGRTETFSAPADLDVNGMVDFRDFAVLAGNWLDEQLWP